MSKLADEMFFLLKETFPHTKIQKEYTIRHAGAVLYVDFFLPLFLIAIEVHGRQHDVFVEHFHGDAWGWKKHKRRDRIKEEWADLNSITYVIIREEDKPKTKEEMLRRCGSGEF